MDVVTARGLVRWLQRQPAVLTSAEVEVLAVAAARRHRTAWRLGAGAVGSTALATLGPEAAHRLGAALIP